MNKVKSYKDLLVWQKGIELVKLVYAVSSLIPDDERFGLISQIRRCSVSVPSNIAEGYGRATTAYFIQFLNISRGSLFELETQLILCKDLNYIKRTGFRINR
jgi:four helix bundle protein